MSNSPTTVLLLLLLPLFLRLQLSTATAASDLSECMDQVAGLLACLPYVQGNSTAPTPGCCTGLKEVLNKSLKCWCVLIKDRNDPQLLDLKINLSVALGLPSACSAPAKISECPKILKLDPNSPDAKIFAQTLSPAQAPAPNTTAGKANTPTNGHEKSGAIFSLLALFSFPLYIIIHL